MEFSEVVSSLSFLLLILQLSDWRWLLVSWSYWLNRWSECWRVCYFLDLNSVSDSVPIIADFSHQQLSSFYEYSWACTILQVNWWTEEQDSSSFDKIKRSWVVCPLLCYVGKIVSDISWYHQISRSPWIQRQDECIRCRQCHSLFWHCTHPLESCTWSLNSVSSRSLSFVWENRIRSLKQDRS